MGSPVAAWARGAGGADRRHSSGCGREPSRGDERPVKVKHDEPALEPLDYEKLVEMFNRALIDTLRHHSVADSFLDFWVPDADPVLGVASMVDSARMGGLDTVSIRFRNSTVPAERLQELQQTLAKFCMPNLEMQRDGMLLTATNIGLGAQVGVARADGSKPPYRRAHVRANVHERETRGPAEWESDETFEFSDVNPHFRSGLMAALATVSREDDADRSSADLIWVAGRERGVKLILSVDPRTHTVQTAHHSGATKSSQRAVLDLLCKAAEKLPIQEAADHAILRVLASLVDKDGAPPVNGVLLPANAGAPFMLSARLARRAYDAYRARTRIEQGTNFYHAPPAAAWRALSMSQRLEKTSRVLGAFLQSQDLYPDDMRVLRIEKNKHGYEVRMTIGFSERVATAEKPNLMRRLERRLRRDLEHEIDLVADRARDTSPLRRLS